MVSRWLCRLTLVLLAIAFGAGCIRSALPATERPPAARVDVIAVGKADAILVSSAAGKHLLIDGG